MDGKIQFAIFAIRLFHFAGGTHLKPTSILIFFELTFHIIGRINREKLKKLPIFLPNYFVGLNII